MRIRKRPPPAQRPAAQDPDGARSWLLGPKEQEQEVKVLMTTRTTTSRRRNKKKRVEVAEKQQEQQQNGSRHGYDSSSTGKKTNSRSSRSAVGSEEEEEEDGGLMALAWATTRLIEQEEEGEEEEHCRDECKAKGGPISSSDGIGEEPRTPPRFCGEKPAEHEKKKEEAACSCGKKKQKRVLQEEDSGSSSKKQREGHHSCSQGTADSSGRSSHENCGHKHRVRDEEGGNHRRTSSRGDGEESWSSLPRELSGMGPLLRAVHAVVAEAGVEGLTAREASDVIRNRGMLGEGELPRSVKMAKAMRDSPYLVELSSRGGNGKFVMWSTFLAETGKGRTLSLMRPRNGSAAAAAAAAAAQAVAAGRRGRKLPQQEKHQQQRHHNQQQQQQQKKTNETLSSRMDADVDLLARVLEHVEKTLRTQATHHTTKEYEQQQSQQQQQQKKKLFLIDINCEPPVEVETGALVEVKHQQAQQQQQQQQQQRNEWPLLDLNLAPEEWP